jgi:hypothetical protein
MHVRGEHIFTSRPYIVAGPTHLIPPSPRYRLRWVNTLVLIALVIFFRCAAILVLSRRAASFF